MVGRFARSAAKVKGVMVSPSMYGDMDAYWVDGKEIAHEEPDAIDLRLTRAVIRLNRDRLKNNPKVTLRKSGGDWLQIGIETPDDVRFALEMFSLAVEAHLPRPDAAAKLPPTGAALQRRRKLH